MNYVVVLRLPVLSFIVAKIAHALRRGLVLVTLDLLKICVVEQRVIEHEPPSLLNCFTKKNGGSSMKAVRRSITPISDQHFFRVRGPLLVVWHFMILMQLRQRDKKCKEAEGRFSRMPARWL